MVIKTIIHPFFLLLASERNEAKILNCCHQAEWNGRTYDSSGTIKIGIDEVPLYRSVGDSTNSGNLISMNWERSDGKVHPSLFVTKQTNIDGEEMMITEEIGKAGTQVDGSLTCPDQMEWKDVNETIIEWKCLPPSDDCVDAGDFCQMTDEDIAQKCVTLSKICCQTCTDFRLKLEEAVKKQAEETAATADPPAEKDIQEEPTEDADETESVEEETENGTNPSAEPSPEPETPSSNETSSEPAEEKAEPEPEPEAGSGSELALGFALIFISLML